MDQIVFDRVQSADLVGSRSERTEVNASHKRDRKVERNKVLASIPSKGRCPECKHCTDAGGYLVCGHGPREVVTEARATCDRWEQRPEKLPPAKKPGVATMEAKQVARGIEKMQGKLAPEIDQELVERAKAAKVGEKVRCPICRGEFPKASHLSVYCSQKCADKAHYIQKKYRFVQNAKRDGEDENFERCRKMERATASARAAKAGDDVTCPWCGKAFTKNRHNQAYCCKNCKDLAANFRMDWGTL